MEQVLTAVRSNPDIDPVMHVWGWEVPIYLDLGGLTAGILFFAALMILMGKQQQTPFVSKQSPLLAPIVLSLGMATLFLDLEYKLHVFRFYTAFQPASPMSWGSWMLMVVYPLSFLLILATLRGGYPRLAGYVDRVAVGRGLMNLSERFVRPISVLTIVFAIGLGVYTGILLSSMVARPFWNTGILGPLFLTSGLSTGAAVGVLGATLLRTSGGEAIFFAKINIGLILVEILLVIMWVINLTTGVEQQQQAAGLVLGGHYTMDFWLLFMGAGLLVPALLYALALKGSRPLMVIAPLLILFGGFMLRHIAVEAGQETTWIEYTNQYDPVLLERLHMLDR